MNILRRSKNKAVLFLIDDLHPEDGAMLQALYSRSGESVEAHLEKMIHAPMLSGNFMKQFYVGYGHKSIADCGSTTLFAEGVSMLAAKAIQDWPLYSGQESSTRYLDMGKRRIVDPIGTAESARILERWMAFYNDSQEPTAEEVRRRYPKAPDEDSLIYEKAVRARTFDILRGFLPAGITTQLSWHTNIRQACDHLSGMKRHPLAEVRGLGEEWSRMLTERYPSSGTATGSAALSGIGSKGEDDRAAEERERWEEIVSDYAYQAPDSDTRFYSTVSNYRIEMWREIFSTRPRGCVLPHFLSDLGQVTFQFLLDFGSFRDIQRHRNGACRMPMLGINRGFELWYLEQLDPTTRGRAVDLIVEQEDRISKLKADYWNLQYYVAMGYRVPCSVTYGLPAAVYVMELRSTKAVHPTLRKVVMGMIRDFRAAHPEVALHVCEDPDPWDIRRGTQDITRRTS